MVLDLGWMRPFFILEELMFAKFFLVLRDFQFSKHFCPPLEYLLDRENFILPLI